MSVLRLMLLTLVVASVGRWRGLSQARAQDPAGPASTEALPSPPPDVELSKIDGVSVQWLSDVAAADERQGSRMTGFPASFECTKGRLVEALQGIVPDEVYVLDNGQLPEGLYDVSARGTGSYENAIIWTLQDALGVTFGISPGRRPVYELVQIEGQPLSLPLVEEGDKGVGTIYGGSGKTLMIGRQGKGTWGMVELLGELLGTQVVDRTDAMGVYKYELELTFDRSIKKVMALPIRQRRPLMLEAFDEALQPFGLSLRKRMAPAQIVTYHSGDLPDGVRLLIPPAIPMPPAGEELSTVPEVSIVRIPSERKLRIIVDYDHNKQLPLERIGIREALRVLLGPDVWVPRHSPVPAGCYDISVSKDVAPEDATALAIQAIERLSGAKIEVKKRGVPGFEIVAADGAAVSLPIDTSEGSMNHEYDIHLRPSMYRFERARLADLASLMQQLYRRPVADRTQLDGRYKFSVPVDSQAPMMTAKFLRPHGIDVRRTEVTIDTAVFVSQP
ncbi:MAG: DUF3738 domain-containing protein [Planctomycetota bacterium]